MSKPRVPSGSTLFDNLIQGTTGGQAVLISPVGGNSPLEALEDLGNLAGFMKKSGCAIVVLFLALCGSMFMNAVLLAGLSTKSASGIRIAKPRTYEEQILIAGVGTKEKIAVIPLDGLIAFGVDGALGNSMVDDLKVAFQQAANDPEVKGIVMSVDSPGGEITASDVIYHEISKLSMRKPVVYYMNSIGASGAYYAACGASWIMCSDTTFTGSIGVIISTLNYKELFGKIGLQTIVFKSGKFKDMLNGGRDMTPEERAYIQGLVMQSYGRFVGIVAKARKLDEQELRTGVADGRILSGIDAHQARLIDQLGYIEDAYAKARELAGSPGASVVIYKPYFALERLLRMFTEAAAPAVEFDFLGKLAKLEPGRTYLLPPFYAP